MRKIESEELKYKCNVCTEAYVRQDILDRHTRAEHPEQSGCYCQFCYVNLNPKDKRKGENQRLEKHKNLIHSELSEEDFKTGIDFRELKYDCQKCDKKFLTENSSLFHKYSCHINSDQNRCSLCDMDFEASNSTKPAYSTLKYHIENIHTGQELKALDEDFQEHKLKYKCTKCDTHFLTENILKYHTSYSHREDKKCPSCDETFPWRKNRAHTMKVHMEENHPVKEIAGNETVNNFMRVFQNFTPADR